MMAVVDLSDPDQVFATDACLLAGGGWHEDRRYFHTVFPSFIQDKQLDINCLEFLVIIVACKLWGKLWKGKRLVVRCDNLVSVTVMNSGRTKEEFLQSCVRELCYMSATHEFEILGVHIPGVVNRIPDALSRWELGEEYQRQFLQLAGSEPMKDIFVYSGLFEFSHKW